VISVESKIAAAIMAAPIRMGIALPLRSGVAPHTPDIRFVFSKIETRPRPPSLSLLFLGERYP